jgi:hypothetical protein
MASIAPRGVPSARRRGCAPNEVIRIHADKCIIAAKGQSFCDNRRARVNGEWMEYASLFSRIAQDFYIQKLLAFRHYTRLQIEYRAICLGGTPEK